MRGHKFEFASLIIIRVLERYLIMRARSSAATLLRPVERLFNLSIINYKKYANTAAR